MKPNEFAHISDQELMEKFQQSHDNEWLGILLQRYTLLLLGVCMKYLKNEEDARDSVQQVFLKVISELHKYKVDYFKSWIYMVAKNHCLMKIRDRQGKMAASLNEEMVIAADDGAQKLEKLEQDRQLELMATCLKELNKEQQQCVTLFYLEKKSYQEITELTGFSLLQVKSHLQNGKRNLKISLEKKMSH